MNFKKAQALKICLPKKLKQLSVIFILNYINSSLIMQKNILYMTLLVHKHLEELFQLLVTCVRFLFTAIIFVIS